MKNRVVGEAETSLNRLDSIESRASALESVRLKNEIEIENLRSDCEDLDIKARIADEKARNAYAEVRNITLDYIGLHYTTLHCITSHYITLHYITLHYITLHYITLHYITLHYITLHYITLHYITLHYITLHYITLHYITLH